MLILLISQDLYDIFGKFKLMRDLLRNQAVNHWLDGDYMDVSILLWDCRWPSCQGALFYEHKKQYECRVGWVLNYTHEISMHMCWGKCFVEGPHTTKICCIKSVSGDNTPIFWSTVLIWQRTKWLFHYMCIRFAHLDMKPPTKKPRSSYQCLIFILWL